MKNWRVTAVLGLCIALLVQSSHQSSLACPLCTSKNVVENGRFQLNCSRALGLLGYCNINSAVYCDTEYGLSCNGEAMAIATAVVMCKCHCKQSCTIDPVSNAVLLRDTNFGVEKTLWVEYTESLTSIDCYSARVAACEFAGLF